MRTSWSGRLLAKQPRPQRALRRLEQEHGFAPTPILFFSGLVCDERLRGLLKTLRPGFYLNKATITSQADLAARLREVLRHLAGRER